MTVKEPQQLTLWPDDALPGQLPLFNRRARVRMLSEMASGYCVRCEAVVVRHFPGDLCFHCETVTAAFLASRKILPTSNSPAAEPIWEPGDRFGKRPQVDLVPTADLPMKDPPPYSGTRSLGQIGPGRPLLTSSLSPDRSAVRLDFAEGGLGRVKQES